MMMMWYSEVGKGKEARLVTNYYTQKEIGIKVEIGKNGIFVSWVVAICIYQFLMNFLWSTTEITS